MQKKVVLSSPVVMLADVRRKIEALALHLHEGPADGADDAILSALDGPRRITGAGPLA